MKSTTKKAAATPRRQPQDHRAKAESAAPQPTPITAEDYGLDINVVLAQLGVDPRMVIENSVRLALVDGAIVCEYGVRRAIPPRIMGMALLAGAAHTEVKEEDDEPDG